MQSHFYLETVCQSCRTPNCCYISCTIPTFFHQRLASTCNTATPVLGPYHRRSLNPQTHCISYWPSLYRPVAGDFGGVEGLGRTPPPFLTNWLCWVCRTFRFFVRYLKNGYWSNPRCQKAGDGPAILLHQHSQSKQCIRVLFLGILHFITYYITIELTRNFILNIFWK